jgi:flavin-dependent dehydrogenase
MKLSEDFDVIITGGGLAGLTCALQLKQANPDISVLVLEKRKDDAPAATHKVGESLSELAAYYMRDVLDLKEYLMEHQLRKFGFRYFFSPEHSEHTARRVEVGSKMFNPFPSHQVDRGVLENELVRRLTNCGVDIVFRAKVTDMELSKDGHKIRFVKEDEESCIKARWIVDSTGRSSLLKRKLGLQKDLNHDINSSWFRLDAVIDIDDWSDDLEWRNFVDPGLRRLATNHLMGEVTGSGSYHWSKEEQALELLPTPNIIRLIASTHLKNQCNGWRNMSLMQPG